MVCVPNGTFPQRAIAVRHSRRLRRLYASAPGGKTMAIKATWHVKLTRGDHARTAFTDYLNRVPKRGAIETVHVDGEGVKLRIDVVHAQTHARAASLGVFDVLATEVD
jgi:hypothetical protein